jgi:hypothetical protein
MRIGRGKARHLELPPIRVKKNCLSCGLRRTGNGALAIGALAIGALAIGRLSIRRRRRGSFISERRKLTNLRSSAFM